MRNILKRIWVNVITTKPRRTRKLTKTLALIEHDVCIENLDTTLRVMTVNSE